MIGILFYQMAFPMGMAVLPGNHDTRAITKQKRNPALP
jgi:hypothetical protein